MSNHNFIQGYNEPRNIKFYVVDAAGAPLVLAADTTLLFIYHSPQTWTISFTSAQVLTDARGNYINVILPSPATINASAGVKVPVPGIVRFELKYIHPSEFDVTLLTGHFDIVHSLPNS